MPSVDERKVVGHAVGAIKVGAGSDFLSIGTYSYVSSFQQQLMIMQYSCRHCQRIDFVEPKQGPMPVTGSTKSILWQLRQEYSIIIRCCWMMVIEL